MSRKPKLICFTGRMGSGKSTAVSCLEKRSVYKVYTVKFAQPLYDMQEFIYERIASVYPKPNDFVKDRRLLQWLGTDWGRQTVGPNLWVDLWKNTMTRLIQHYPHGVFTCDDVRFDNEAEAIKSLGGSIVKIVSNQGDDRINTTNGFSNHVTEKGIDEKYVDYIINNEGSIEEFQGSLYTVFQRTGILD